MFPDWHATHQIDHDRPIIVDSRRRIGVCAAVFWGLLVVVIARVVELEWTQGDAFRKDAVRPIERRESIPGTRGRILARNGVVLVQDREVLALALHYRLLQDPPDAAWLRAKARGRLTRTERRDPKRMAEAEREVLAARDRLLDDVRQMANVTESQWKQRTARIQARVERIAASVNRRRYERWVTENRAEEARVTAEAAGAGTWRRRAIRLVEDIFEGSMDRSAPKPIPVAEEVDYHVVVEGISLRCAAEIEANPERYQGVRIVARNARYYVGRTAASHVVGYLGHVGAEDFEATAEAGGRHPEDWIGRAGVEAQYDDALHGRRGEVVELRSLGGKVLSREQTIEPQTGCDVTLTIDAALQATAESLLEQAIARRAVRFPKEPPAGGAIVVMEVASGELLAMASKPDFAPECLTRDDRLEVTRLLEDATAPLFNRATQMAIPIGSVFKPVAAAALLDAGVLRPETVFHCQGYLHRPDALRCAVFKRHGHGHGDITLSDALCASCNVYFFHFARQAGRTPLVVWADRFGFGRATGVDLPAESPGRVPSPIAPGAGAPHSGRDPEALLLSVGQGRFGATPLQVARMMAAIANGGVLVAPHVVRSIQPPPSALFSAGSDDDTHVPPLPTRGANEKILGLPPATIDAIRDGLERVVADPAGTAHATGWTASVPYAGKTGTAETGSRAEHAWFAGYAPLDPPRFAIVVALEHAGDASDAACPVAKRIVLRLAELGYFDGLSSASSGFRATP